MAEISTTQAFSDGDTVTATKLNNITANASIQADAITNRSAETTVDQANDLLLMYDASASSLKKVTLSNAIKAGTASNFPVTGNATVGGTLGVTGNTTLTGTLGIQAGTAAAPAIAPSSDTNTGIFFPAADTVAATTNGTEAVRIDSSGNVGLKNTAPSTTFSAVGGYGLAIGDGTGWPSIALYGANNAGQGIYFGDSNTGTASYAGFIDYLHQSDALRLGTASTERLRITSDGTILFAKNVANVGTVGYRFDTTGETYTSLSATTNAMSTNCIYSTGASAYRFYVGMTGTVFATNTTISAISDARLKENIRDIDSGLQSILALKPRLFDWKEGKGADKKNVMGFIAQEIEQVFPDLVDEWKDPAPEGEEPYKSVRHDLIPVLVKAIQELSNKIETLESKVAALEAA